METIPAELAKNEIQSLVNLVKNEVKYLFCFNRYAQEFEKKKGRLEAMLEDVSSTIDKTKGASSVTRLALRWKEEAEDLIDRIKRRNAERNAEKEKRLNDLCLNCWSQYKKGRDLVKLTLYIDELRAERGNFEIVAGPTDLPGLKDRSSSKFMHFESRNEKFRELKGTLQGEENNTIGLQGLGGTGKTSMAVEVGAELEGFFGKVIFLVVSKLPNFKKLRREISGHLDLELKDEEEELHHERILKKISELKGKLLIVLDDVWKKFDLTKELGIPPCHLRKGCTVLITSRNKDICRTMECQMVIELDELTGKDALSLFLEHSKCPPNLESLALNIVERCHGIPVVIVAVAGTLKGRPPRVWKEALRNSQKGESILSGNYDLKEYFHGLKLSYDNLKNEIAKKLLLISSLFPENFEIPQEFLCRTGVGMGPFGEDDDYDKRREKALDAIEELQDSSLLLNAEMECVKMHDLVHEVASLIREKDMKSIIESEQPIEKGLKCLFWQNNDFAKQLDGGNLEILIMLLHKSYGSDLKGPDRFFSEMTKLKVLFLQIEGPSLLPSIQSLQSLRTLKLEGFELCCISMLGKLLNLETLWLNDCSITKLCQENFDLGKLRFLRIEHCEIKMSNPFELIKACPKLEELTFFDNRYDEKKEKDTISQKVSFQTFDIYQISSDDLSNYFERHGSLLSRCFQPGNLMHLISKETFEKLARTSELLILEGYDKTEHTNLIPDIVPVEDRDKTDLIILKLDSFPNMQCLIVPVREHAFSELVEISLYEMGLSNILFNGNYDLCRLKIMELQCCPKLTSIFDPRTAQRLLQLEKLIIEECHALECIIEDKSSRGEIAGDDGDNNQKSYGNLFPKLKVLQIARCGNLEIILPFLPCGGPLERITIQICEKVKYIFEKFQEMLSSDMEMELCGLPSLVGIFREYTKSISSSRQQPACTASSTKRRSLSWAQVCCFKSRATSEEANGAVSTQDCGIKSFIDENMVNLTTAKGLRVSKKWIDTVRTLGGQLVLEVRQIKKMKLANLSFSSISTLFTLSMASMVSWEELTITNFDGLKHLVTSEDDDFKDQINCRSIFPKLQNLQIWECRDLEFLFLSSISIEIKNLKSLIIGGAPKLTYVVGKYHHENQHDELRLPSLEALCFVVIPEFISIGPKNFIVASPSLQKVSSDEGQRNSNTTKELNVLRDRYAPSLACQGLSVQSLKNVREIDICYCGNVMSLSTLSIAASTIALEILRINYCHKLNCITMDKGDAQVDKNHCLIFPTLEKLEIQHCEGLEILFVSTISVGLQKLKYLIIGDVPKLKYVVGNYQKGQRPSNQNQNDELCFNLPALEFLHIYGAPMMNGICSKQSKLELSYRLDVLIEDCGIKSFIDEDMVNLTTAEELYTSKDRGAPSLTFQSLLVQSLKNVRTIKLVECRNIISLSTLSIADSIIVLETLIICKCHKLKCITTDEGDDQVDENHYSFFPTLKKLEIMDCEGLEILFVSARSVSLQKLKSLTIMRVPKLKYVVGNQKEQHPSNQNQNNELCFHLPALETIYINAAPMINGICSKKSKLKLSSRLEFVIEDCGIKSFIDDSMVNLTTAEEVHASTDGAPLFYVAQNLLTNIKRLEVVDCANLISLLPLSVASIILLEVLTIKACGQLKYIVADEGDDRTQNNYNSIFPKLKTLEVAECHALEYLFPAYAFRSPLYLESLDISGAPMLKYAFGRSQNDDRLSHENQNIKTLIDLPALKCLTVRDVPKLVSVYPEDYNMTWLYLKSIILGKLPKFTMRPANEFLVCWHAEQQETKVIEMCWKTLESLEVHDLKIEEIFDLTYMGREKKGGELRPLTSSLKELRLKNLSDLMNICVGLKCTIRFDCLWTLTIKACKKLRVIFSASTVRSLPMLEYLVVSECEELVHIVEEDYETNVGDHFLLEPCFPNLEHVFISDCDKLRYLFSITISGILPQLRSLRIYNAYELNHVLIKQDEMKEKSMENVLPQLRILKLKNLRNLISVCHGINFQKEDYFTEVYDCPKFETWTPQHQADPETGYSQVEEKAEEIGEEITQQSFTKVVEARAKGVSSYTVSQIFPTSEKEVPIHASLSLTVLPTRDNTHACAKIFEEEEEEQGGLITSRRLQIGMKASSSLSKEKLETSIDGDSYAPPGSTILSDQTSRVILPLSPLSSKASTSLNQNPFSILSKASDELPYQTETDVAIRSVIDLIEVSNPSPSDSTHYDDVQVYDKSHPHSNKLFEGADHGDIKEPDMVQSESTSNVELSTLTIRTQGSSYSKGQIQTNNQLIVSQPRSTIPTSPFVTISQDECSEIVEVTGEEGALIFKTRCPSFLTSTEEPIHVSLNSTFLPRSPSTTVKILEEEEEGGLITIPRHQRDMKAVSSLPLGKEHKTSNQGDPFVPTMPIISSEQQASNTILPLSLVPSKALMSYKPVSMSTSSQSSYGADVQENVGTTTHPLHEGLDAIQISSQHAECGPSEMVSSIYDSNNASSVVGVKEIVDMMKLEGLEASRLAEAIKANPKLCLSSEVRSTELLCYSYRALLNILSILDTRSPFTITGADKRLLAKNLKDASILGFDKDWLESVRIKVFNCDASELHHKQQVLKSLGNKLEANKRELANVRDQEAKAAQSVEMAQKELEATQGELEAAQSHFNVARQDYESIRARHSQLLEECQEILEQRDQCSEIVAAKLMPFGF